MKKWEIVDELPYKLHTLWINTKTGCKECFWDEEDPNLKGY